MFNQTDQNILRPAQACQYLGISRTSLHYLHEQDPTFPRKIRLGARAVGWRRESLDSWLEAKERGNL